ncbi:glycosyltransferase family 25 protein, partial [Pleomassaria siparia CBS 279.74]
LVAANSTLGFGAILAVSHETSPRRASLVYAANLTGLDIAIPAQPKWTDEDVQTFMVGEEEERGSKSRISRGSALAWMGHLNALRWFLSTDLQTALILEDDVDFSIHVRREQAPLAAAAVRMLLSKPEGSGSARRQYGRHDADPDYWSSTSNWELLHLGHCSDMLPPPLLSSTAHLAYHDDTVLPQASLSKQPQSLLSTLGAPEATRLVHRSYWPLCTFGYAVTRASASRILSTFGSEGSGGKEGEKQTGCVAFDVRILEACRDRDWKCYTVVPELFHHMAAKSEIKVVNDGVEDQKKRDNGGERRKRTENIACGARQPGFAVGMGGGRSGEEVERDEETARWLMEVIGRGECLEDWGEDDI